MGFFKELKEDLSQAVNELLPEDELLEEEEYINNLDNESIGLDGTKEEKSEDELISDTLENDSLENESDLQLDDDMFVNTLDDELTSTLESEDTTIEDVSLEEENQTDYTDDLSDLVKEFENQMIADESASSKEDNIVSDMDFSEEGTVAASGEEEEMEEKMPAFEEDTILEENMKTENSIAAEDVLVEEDAIAEENETDDLEESLLEEDENAWMNELEEDGMTEENLSMEEEIPDIEDIDLMDILEDEIDNLEQPLEEVTEELEDSILDNNSKLESDSEKEETEQQMEDETMSELDEMLDQTENMEDENVDMDLIAQMLEEEEEEETPFVIPDEMPAMEDIAEEESVMEDLPVEEVIAEQEEEWSKEAADDVTVITKGTRIEGNIITDSAVEVMGTIKGNIECLGKLSVTGHVTGNSSAAEIFVNSTRIEGDLISKGTVKLGAGTVVLGDVAGTSAVIAGAVKGEIDINGPIVVDSTAIIKGNMKAKSVQINNGAVIDGYCSLAYAALDIDNFFDGENAE